MIGLRGCFTADAWGERVEAAGWLKLGLSISDIGCMAGARKGECTAQNDV